MSKCPDVLYPGDSGDVGRIAGDVRDEGIPLAAAKAEYGLDVPVGESPREEAVLLFGRESVDVGRECSFVLEDIG